MLLKAFERRRRAQRSRARRLPPGRPIAPTDLLAMARISDPQLSPDGSRALYSVATPDLGANRTARDVWIVTIATGVDAQPHAQRTRRWRALVAGRQDDRLPLDASQRQPDLPDQRRRHWRSKTADHLLERRRQHRLVARRPVDRVHAPTCFQIARTTRATRRGRTSERRIRSRRGSTIACCSVTGRRGATASACICSSSRRRAERRAI